MNRDDVIETFFEKVLLALDEAANETFKPNRNDSGASDDDLPRLEKWVAEQVDILAERYDVELED